VSVKRPEDSERNSAPLVYEAYTIGVQHGRISENPTVYLGANPSVRNNFPNESHLKPAQAIRDFNWSPDELTERLAVKLYTARGFRVLLRKILRIARDQNPAQFLRRRPDNRVRQFQFMRRRIIIARSATAFPSADLERERIRG